MNEPTYEYVKGSGWVPARVNEVYSYGRHKRIEVYQRIPEEGDAFVEGFLNWTMEDALNHVGGFSWVSYLTYRAHEFNPNCQYFTLKMFCAFCGAKDKTCVCHG
jgi:hypothetical protein